MTDDHDYLDENNAGQTADELAEAIANVLAEAGYDATEGLPEMECLTFAQAGVRTSNAGLVLKLADGTEYQLSLVRSN